MNAGTAIALVGGVLVVGLLVYLVTRPSMTGISVPVGGGTSAGGGLSSSSDPGWGFATSVGNDVASIAGAIAGAFNRPQPTSNSGAH